jgi:hypothetical protein
VNKRKYIRIALSDDDFAMLSNRKSQVEAESGVAMSDSLFALSILRQSLKRIEKAK